MPIWPRVHGQRRDDALVREMIDFDLQPACLMRSSLLSVQQAVLDVGLKPKRVSQRAVCIRTRQGGLSKAVESRCRRGDPGLLIGVPADAAERAQNQDERGAVSREIRPRQIQPLPVTIHRDRSVMDKGGPSR
jgi:hypothetical protein